MRKYIIEKDYSIVVNGKHMIIKNKKINFLKKHKMIKAGKTGEKETQKQKHNAKKQKTRIAISNRNGKYKEKSEYNLDLKK